MYGATMYASGQYAGGQVFERALGVDAVGLLDNASGAAEGQRAPTDDPVGAVDTTGQTAEYSRFAKGRVTGVGS